MERCFSTIAIKSLDEDLRQIRGVASTPEPDHMLDIVEPLGLRFPRDGVSLLWQHRHDTPVGTCRFDRPTKAGVTFTASLPKVGESGPFKDSVDYAWSAVKYGTCKGVSIGFVPIEAEPLPTGGTRFKKASLIELSLVSCPANQSATITEIKAIDAAVRRGEAPVASGTNGSLWSKIGNIGLNALNEFDASQARREIGDRLGPTVSAARSAQEMIKALCNHVDDLERRLTESPLEYRGVWAAGTYPARSFVTHNGSCWHTDKATTRKPGEGDWVLAVKRGADAK